MDSAFWFTFAGYRYPHHTDPRYDLDLASYGVVRLEPDMSWEPKESFHALAAERQGLEHEWLASKIPKRWSC